MSEPPKSKDGGGGAKEKKLENTTSSISKYQHHTLENYHMNCKFTMIFTEQFYLMMVIYMNSLISTIILTRIKSLKSYSVSKVNFYFKLRNLKILKSRKTGRSGKIRGKSGKIRKPDKIPEKKIIKSNLRSNPLIV